MVEGNLAFKRHQVILVRPSGILKMSANSIGSDLGQPLPMIQKTKVMPHLGMTEIMPVPQPGGIKALQECKQLPLRWESLIVAPILNHKGDIQFHGLLKKDLKSSIHSVEVHPCVLLPPSDRIQLQPVIVTVGNSFFTQSFEK